MPPRASKRTRSTSLELEIHHQQIVPVVAVEVADGESQIGAPVVTEVALVEGTPIARPVREHHQIESVVPRSVHQKLVAAVVGGVENEPWAGGDHVLTDADCRLETGAKTNHPRTRLLPVLVLEEVVGTVAVEITGSEIVNTPSA